MFLSAGASWWRAEFWLDDPAGSCSWSSARPSLGEQLHLEDVGKVAA